MSYTRRLRSQALAGVFLLAMSGAYGLAAQVQAPQERATHEPPTQEQTSAARRVARVDIFGYYGWDGPAPFTEAVRKRLAARVGRDIAPGGGAAFRRAIQADITETTGKPATDVAIICCDEQGGLNVFVGVPGESSIPLEPRSAPTAGDTLPDSGLQLYKDAAAALRAADARGLAKEDDSSGYALSEEPLTRAAQQKLHTYALTHEEVLIRVLHRAGAVEQRQAAAELLGYGKRTPAQTAALLFAVNDSDDDVRNNAVRALAVLASTGPLPGLNLQTFVGLLYSGVWTDRNKASAVLLQLTAKRDPKLLKFLGEQALPPLIEGALWQSKSHAFAFAMVLGRVAGLPEERITTLFNEGHADAIVSAARAADSRNGKR